MFSARTNKAVRFLLILEFFTGELCLIVDAAGYSGCIQTDSHFLKPPADQALPICLICARCFYWQSQMVPHILYPLQIWMGIIHVSWSYFHIHDNSMSAIHTLVTQIMRPLWFARSFQNSSIRICLIDGFLSYLFFFDCGFFVED